MGESRGTLAEMETVKSSYVTGWSGVLSRPSLGGREHKGCALASRAVERQPGNPCLKSGRAQLVTIYWNLLCCLTSAPVLNNELDSTLSCRVHGRVTVHLSWWAQED